MGNKSFWRVNQSVSQSVSQSDAAHGARWCWMTTTLRTQTRSNIWSVIWILWARHIPPSKCISNLHQGHWWASYSLDLRPGRRTGTSLLESESSEHKINNKTDYIAVTVNVKSLPECATVDSAVQVTLQMVIIYEYCSKILVSLHHTTHLETVSSAGPL
jgi:hypothetical protein